MSLSNQGMICICVLLSALARLLEERIAPCFEHSWRAKRSFCRSLTLESSLSEIPSNASSNRFVGNDGSQEMRRFRRSLMTLQRRVSLIGCLKSTHSPRRLMAVTKFGHLNQVFWREGYFHSVYGWIGTSASDYHRVRGVKKLCDVP